MSPLRTMAPPLGLLCFLVAVVLLVVGQWQVAAGLVVAGILLWLAREKVDPVLMRELEDRYDVSEGDAAIPKKKAPEDGAAP